MPLVSTTAPAKINLYLHVTGRRADGYHLLDSLVIFANDICDRIEIEPAASLSLDISGPFAGQIDREDEEDNLVVRAVRGAARLLGRDDALAIRLEKNIPAGAGLGGGSSDAAAAIRACERLWQARLPESTRAPFLLSLGADVPVCYGAAPARMEGIGEIVTPHAPLPSLPALLIWPGVAAPTRDVFRALDLPAPAPRPIFPEFPRARDLLEFLQVTRNDLEPPAAAICPAIADARDDIASHSGCALARMTGSGSAVFGLFENTAARDAAAAAIAMARPGWWVRAAMI